MYYIYMLRCEDNSIYTGITTDVKRRFIEHFQKTEKCAKYTYTHNVKKIEKVWMTENRAQASKLEYNIKRLSKQNKEALVNNKYKLNDILYEKIDTDLYEEYDIKEIYTNEK